MPAAAVTLWLRWLRLFPPKGVNLMKIWSCPFLVLHMFLQAYWSCNMSAFALGCVLSRIFFFGFARVVEREWEQKIHGITRPVQYTGNKSHYVRSLQITSGLMENNKALGHWKCASKAFDLWFWAKKTSVSSLHLIPVPQSFTFSLSPAYVFYEILPSYFPFDFHHTLTSLIRIHIQSFLSAQQCIVRSHKVHFNWISQFLKISSYWMAKHSVGAFFHHFFLSWTLLACLLRGRSRRKTSPASIR